MEMESMPKQEAKPIILLVLLIVTLLISSTSLVLLLVNNVNADSSPLEETIEVEEAAQDASEENEEEVMVVDDTDTMEFESLLFEKDGWYLPFGAAEIEGYYTTVGRATSLDGSTPAVTCSAFQVTDGPKILLDKLEEGRYGASLTAVLGEEEMYLSNSLKQSTAENPIRLVVTLNPVHEGELIGCMAWPFSEVIELD
jgi:hypothetical protein